VPGASAQFPQFSHGRMQFRFDYHFLPASFFGAATCLL
jgi:hypothetical protein